MQPYRHPVYINVFKKNVPAQNWMAFLMYPRGCLLDKQQYGAVRLLATLTISEFIHYCHLSLDHYDRKQALFTIFFSKQRRDSYA